MYIPCITFAILIFLIVKGLSPKAKDGITKRACENQNEINKSSLEQTVIHKIDSFLRTY